MIAFRDTTARALGLELLVHINRGGLAQGISPFTHGSEVHTDMMKTQALKQALDLHGFDWSIRRRTARRGKIPRQGAHLLVPQRRAPLGPQEPAAGTVADLQPAHQQGESVRVFPLSNWTELDVWHYIRAEKIPVVPLYFAKERPVVERDGKLIMVDDERMRLEAGRAAGDAPGAVPHPRLLSADRRGGKRRRTR